MGVQRAKIASVAQRYDALPPSAFEVVFARCAIAPLIPALATFAKTETLSLPSQARNVARPRSIVRTSPVSATSAASSIPRGIPYVRTKSQPVPRGTTASSGAASRPTSPFATSFTEPSPPTTTSSRAPPSAASRASSAEVALPLAEERVALEPRRGGADGRAPASGAPSRRSRTRG